MSSPFEGPPSLPFDTANGAAPPRPAPTDDELDAELAKLNPPRKYYQNYQRTRGANDNMLHAPQGLHAFFRAYYHYKSADWKGNKPHPLKARTAEEMAQMPTYYVMEKDKGMAETVAPFMPSAAEIAACKWLTEAEVDVYATEYARTEFTGALQGYRVRRGSDPKSIAEMRTFSGRTIDVPSMFIAGKSDWGVYQTPGARGQDADQRLHAHGGLPSGRRRRALGAAGAAGTGEHVAHPVPAGPAFARREILIRQRHVAASNSYWPSDTRSTHMSTGRIVVTLGMSGILLSMAVPAIGQAGQGAADRPVASRPWPPARLADGQPDVHGVWAAQAEGRSR